MYRLPSQNPPNLAPYQQTAAPQTLAAPPPPYAASPAAQNTPVAEGPQGSAEPSPLATPPVGYGEAPAKTRRPRRPKGAVEVTHSGPVTEVQEDFLPPADRETAATEPQITHVVPPLDAAELSLDALLDALRGRASELDLQLEITITLGASR